MDESKQINSHDHNFKNLFLDFPKEALAWLFPQVLQEFGKILNIQFLRQEPKKRKLSDSHLSLDMPILFTFQSQRVILWLIEFQEDKSKFSIYHLLRYVTDMAEAYPDTIIIPTVLFTDRKKWRKDVDRKLKIEFKDQTFLLFNYILIKLFDFQAKDYYHSSNPLIQILLPKMNYHPNERHEVFIQAFKGLHQLASSALFEKYADFISLYADIKEEERDEIVKKLEDRKDTCMIAQYIKDKGIQQGVKQGIQQGVKQGIQRGKILNSKDNIIGILQIKFKELPSSLVDKINNLNDIDLLNYLLKQSAIVSSIEEFESVIYEGKWH
jgi:hypothetical protein